MSIGRGGVMEAKCPAIAHAELGGIAAQRAAHCRPHLVENRTMTSNMMSSPPVDRAHFIGSLTSKKVTTLPLDIERAQC